MTIYVKAKKLGNVKSAKVVMNDIGDVYCLYSFFVSPFYNVYSNASEARENPTWCLQITL